MEHLDVTREIGLRRATDTDHDRVTSIVSLAFANDPLWARALAQPDGGTEHGELFWSIFVEGALRYPWVWLTEGSEATSVWIPPGGTEMTADQEERLARLANQYLGASADAYLELLGRFEAAHPRGEPHYYLSLLGTHPEFRGRGIGMSVLARNLELIDAEELPAYLESSNPANNARYARLGFEVVGEFAYPGGEPTVTTMWRSARGRH